LLFIDKGWGGDYSEIIGKLLENFKALGIPRFKPMGGLTKIRDLYPHLLNSEGGGLYITTVYFIFPEII